MKKRRRRDPEAKPLHQQVEDASLKREPRKIETDFLIPSGSTLLNCACSDNPFGAYPLGKIITIPGGSVSGKTILCLTTFAEANLIETLNNYDFIYDDIEEALEFDMSYLFGEHVSRRIKAPAYDGKEPIYSDTIQDLEGHIIRRCKGKSCRPFIYILDSLDALTSDEEVEREYKNALIRAKSAEHADDIAKSYNTEKARIIGRVLRMIKKELKISQSTLLIVQQERDKIGATFGKKYTTSGGRAPFYYSTHQVRLNRISTLKSKERKIGSNVKAEVAKNKLTGKEREVEFRIYYDYGIDDVSSCVDFLCKEHWKHPKEKGKGKEKTGSWIAEELGVTGNKATIIDHIEEEELEAEMKKLVGVVWNEIEKSLRLDHRKRKFV
jgi:recombination protein RecA